MVASGGLMVARVDGREAFAVPVEQQTRQGLAVRGACLEVDEVAGSMG